MEREFDAIVIGGGPAGLTAGIYLSRAKMKTLILNQGAVGGQTVLTHEVANYPGVEHISGYQLARNMKSQAMEFGCTIKSNIKIEDLDLTGRTKSVTTSRGETFSAKSVVLATGGRSRALNIPGEEEYKGKGISYCATCDGDFFEGKEIIVVGGGNSALEEAVSLTKYATKVTVVHQFDHFQAFEHAVKEAQANPKVEFMMESVLTEFSGSDVLENVKIRDLKTGEISSKKVDGVFILIGYVPNTEMFKNLIQLNARGEVIVNGDMETNVEGVFSAGDSNQKKYRQITTAVADGTVAALNAIEFINN